MPPHPSSPTALLPRPAAPRSCRAFTLIELVVVVGIVGLLIGLLLPAMLSVRKASQQVACAANLRQIGLALASYSFRYRTLPYAYISGGYDNGPTEAGHGPGAFCSSWDDLLNADLRGNLTDAEKLATLSPRPCQTLICPADDVPRALTVPNHKLSYGIVTINVDPVPPDDRTFLGTAGRQDVSDWAAAGRIAARITLRPNEVRRPSATFAVVDWPRTLNSQGYSGSGAFASWSFVQIKPPHHGRYNALFHDGHVTAVLEPDCLGTGTPGDPHGPWTVAPND